MYSAAASMFAPFPFRIVLPRPLGVRRAARLTSAMVQSAGFAGVLWLLAAM